MDIFTNIIDQNTILDYMTVDIASVFLQKILTVSFDLSKKKWKTKGDK